MCVDDEWHHNSTAHSLVGEESWHPSTMVFDEKGHNYTTRVRNEMEDAMVTEWIVHMMEHAKQCPKQAQRSACLHEQTAQTLMGASLHFFSKLSLVL